MWRIQVYWYCLTCILNFKDKLDHSLPLCLLMCTDSWFTSPSYLNLFFLVFKCLQCLALSWPYWLTILQTQCPCISDFLSIPDCGDLAVRNQAIKIPKRKLFFLPLGASENLFGTEMNVKTQFKDFITVAILKKINKGSRNSKIIYNKFMRHMIL